jgi:dTDP-glucose pyrophosphorylase
MYNKKERIQKILISPSVSIIDAMKKMDELDVKLLLVAENHSLPALGIVSIGDIQRAIIKQVDLKKSIKEILRIKIRVCSISDSLEQVKHVMQDFRAEFMPLVNENNEIVDIVFWEECFDNDQPRNVPKLDVPVVIMAGGKGTRLKPITNIIPKPLVPIGDKPIIEVIIDQFNDLGVKSFYISVNYKAEMIQGYFSSIPNKNYFLSYFEETQPLGTAGSLYLLKEKINSTFFVTNCDIIINHQLDEIYNFHKENGFELTVVGALKSFSIPYGTIDYQSGGVLKGIEEKPEMTFVVNTGMYVLEPGLINEIPENKFFHITNLINNIIERGGKVGVFPVSEGAWMDIGEWKEYDRTQHIYNNKMKKQ